MQVCGGLYVGDPDTRVHVYLHQVLELGVCVCEKHASTLTHTYSVIHVFRLSHTHTHT
ncbi:hypothetical protein COCMIDRAFT_71917, partial [Bipolaris oryzae ATCC 44560]